MGNKHNLIYILLITCVLGAHASDSVWVSSNDLKALIMRVERLENARAADSIAAVTRDSVSPKMATSETVEQETKAKRKQPLNGRLTIGGYGEATIKRCFYSNNYLRYLTPSKYANDQYGEVDLPHVVFFLGYDFGKGWSIGTEIEFEHGGTESAVEIEEEEGGEYEAEIERGGEVALEQFWIQKRFNQYAVIRAGMQVIPVGGLNAHHEPTEFFGVYRPEGEFTILPSTWHEVALTFMGKTKFGLHYQAMFLPGLDSDRFNRKGWINPGAGSPYEFKLANVYAGAARVDYTGVKGLRLSLSGYCGNSFRNTLSSVRNEEFDSIKGTVSIGSFDFKYDDHNWILRGGVTYGHLGDAAKIEAYNKVMRKDSPSSKQWVASDVIAAGAEIGYDFFSLNPTLKAKNHRFYVWGRYDYYDSMFRHNGERNTTYAWCGRQRISCGFNYFPIKQVAIKGEFSYAILNKKRDASGNLVKFYNDEPAIAFGIVYAGLFQL
ncbi:MAG: hypothetical protein J5902_06795 [Paludibacteraceae bacterium]|nr:hypothetical protein [Paludibacteraceae bacterium]